jgi:hypothetical protein
MKNCGVMDLINGSNFKIYQHTNGTNQSGHSTQLQHTFSISRKSINTQPTVIVELKSGISGYGRQLQILTTT